mmetsp:Transcript_33679/g.78720  ORF Transcript_33679/g.78720 Transcript_33679/m.78720 type:complete len:220 (-) Transcript_33679:494-1153(-)
MVNECPNRWRNVSTVGNSMTLRRLVSTHHQSQARGYSAGEERKAKQSKHDADPTLLCHIFSGPRCPGDESDGLRHSHVVEGCSSLDGLLEEVHPAFRRNEVLADDFVEQVSMSGIVKYNAAMCALIIHVTAGEASVLVAAVHTDCPVLNQSGVGIVELAVHNWSNAVGKGTTLQSHESRSSTRVDRGIPRELEHSRIQISNGRFIDADIAVSAAHLQRG